MRKKIIGRYPERIFFLIKNKSNYLNFTQPINNEIIFFRAGIKIVVNNILLFFEDFKSQIDNDEKMKDLDLGSTKMNDEDRKDRSKKDEVSCCAVTKCYIF